MAEQVRAPKRTRLAGGIIVIKVGGDGENQQTFSIHEDVIKGTSPFFRTALDKKWKEGQAREVTLPEDSADVVSCYLDWCYSKEIISKEFDNAAEVTREHLVREKIFLAKLYVFGEKAQDDGFCDAVITAWAEMTDQKVGPEGTRYFPGARTISIIYDGTPADSPARRFVVDMYVSFGEREWIKDDDFLQIPEFLRDLAIALTMPENPNGDAVRARRKEWFKQKEAV